MGEQRGARVLSRSMWNNGRMKEDEKCVQETNGDIEAQQRAARAESGEWSIPDQAEMDPADQP